jgi:UDP-N-acetylmuramoyl-L-alanyl-D-glutamate--2,6-diaminopimelate ligase
LKTGIISTANIRIGEEESMNFFHMTMPGRSVIQQKLAEMYKKGCKCCVVETTSEGIKQFRHIGLYYDILVFTNLTPEHLPSHDGSFEKYKETKGKIFWGLTRQKRKILDGKKIDKVVIVNNDDRHKEYFLQFAADKKITYGLNEGAGLMAQEILESQSGVDFKVNGLNYHLNILGSFNVYNALPAIIVGRELGLPDDKISAALRQLKMIPGRMEIISIGQNFQVIVDYAHEKESVTRVLQAANKMKASGGKVIILLGAEGGGRDKTKRPIMGELSAKMADYVVCSNVDPYDDDPTPIVEDIAVAAEKFGKVRGKDLFVIEDRRSGINKALSLAKSGDVVLITGKGSEQSIIIGGVSSPWDDRLVVREELEKVYR